MNWTDLSNENSLSDVAKIKAMILAHNWYAVRELLSDWRPPDIADLLLELDKPTRVLLFRCLPREVAAEVFSELEGEDTDALLRDLTDYETQLLLSLMRPDDRTELLEELPGQATQRLLNLLKPEDMEEARMLLGYPEKSVGRLMTPDYVAVRPNWTVSQALEHVRRRGHDSETVDVAYVVDDSWKLLGVVSLRQLVLADPDDTIKDIMTTPAVFLSAFDDREEAARVMDKYDLYALPVVASDGVLVGIVTADDVFEVSLEEAIEDFHKSRAVAPLKAGYLESSLGALLKSRIGWLVVLAIVDLIGAELIAGFQNAISQVVALVFFLPLITGCSGNAGSQSSTLVIRELALGEVDPEDLPKLTTKELLVSVALGLTVALVVCGPAIFQGGPGVGVVVSLSTMITVTLGGVIGLLMPFLLRKLGFDPATSSAPLVTSVLDIIGILTYFIIATRVLNL